MQSVRAATKLSRNMHGQICLRSSLVLILCLAGCGVHPASTNTAPAATQQGPQLYFAPSVAGTTSGSSSTILSPQTYTIDDTGDTFSQATYSLISPQVGPQVLNAGKLSINARGLRSLGITVTYVANNGTVPPQFVPISQNPPEPGFAVELEAQAGGLVQLTSQPVAPMVAANQCPSFSTPQTYQFLTIPAPLAQTSAYGTAFTWDPAAETAYGSVDISASGSTVTFGNIHQQTLSGASGTGVPTEPLASSVTGACGSTFFGNIVNVPGQLPVLMKGSTASVPIQANIGIGSSGLLVENNGAGSQLPPGATLDYNTVLGAGTGAIGLPKPANALDTGALVGAQYLGFIYAAGTYIPGTSGNPAFSSHLASFGFSSVPSNCASVAAATGTLIYGGDFQNDDPSTSADGFGNCDFAIDLGVQDSSTNGLYSHATVSVSPSYPGNTTGASDSFPAVAIAGQLNGKYALFVLGVDARQPWAVYLLQSN